MPSRTPIRVSKPISSRALSTDGQRRWPSVEKARELIGFETKIGVHEGIRQTVEWLREQPVAAG